MSCSGGCHNFSPPWIADHWQTGRRINTLSSINKKAIKQNEVFSQTRLLPRWRLCALHVLNAVNYHQITRRNFLLNQDTRSNRYTYSNYNGKLYQGQNHDKESFTIIYNFSSYLSLKMHKWTTFHFLMQWWGEVWWYPTLCVFFLYLVRWNTSITK